MRTSEETSIDFEIEAMKQKGLLDILDDTATVSRFSSQLDLMKIKSQAELIGKMDEGKFSSDRIIGEFDDAIRLCKEANDTKGLIQVLKLLTEVKYKSKADPNSIAKTLNVHQNLNVSHSDIMDVEIEQELKRRNLNEKKA